jgi:hypothetical protein
MATPKGKPGQRFTERDNITLSRPNFHGLWQQCTGRKMQNFGLLAKNGPSHSPKKNQKNSNKKTGLK